jgi:hypothetical protein
MKNFCNWCHQGDEALASPEKPAVQTSAKAPTCPQCHRGITITFRVGAGSVVEASG